MEIKDIISLANAGFTAAQITALANAQQMQAQQMPQMQAQQMPVVDPVLEQLKQLTGIVQNGNIMAASQPAARNADDIIGTIINPPATDKG